MRIGRAGAYALADAGDPDVNVEIHVLVGDDTETFVGLDDFANGVSEESLAGCHGLRLLVTGREFRVYIPIDIREAGERGLSLGLWDPMWPARPKYPLRTSSGHLGVDLWVDRWDEDPDDHLVSLRNQIAAAIDRGVPRLGEPGSRHELAAGQPFKTVLRGPDDWIAGLVWAVRDGPLLVITVLTFFLPGSATEAYVKLAPLAVLLLFARPLLFWIGVRTLGSLVPPVDLHEQSRERKFRRLAGFLATAFVSGVIGALATALVRML